jgi:rRNA maturation protein Nop10
VVEKNVAGDWFRQALYDKDPRVFYKPVHAQKSKNARAHGLSPIMERGFMHMAGSFEELEKQLCSMTAYDDRVKAHDDRADAWVWGMRELTRIGNSDWGEAYGFRTCLKCGNKVHVHTEKTCRGCGEVFQQELPAPESRRSPVRWSNAYQSTCDQGHEYPMRLKKCPQCHSEVEYLEKVARFTGIKGGWKSYTGGNPLLGRKW